MDRDQVTRVGYEYRERYCIESQLVLIVVRDEELIVETERRDREARTKLVDVPLNNVIGGSAINSHDVDASKRPYFTENLGRDQISFVPLKSSHPYKFPHQVVGIKTN